jgi:oligoribonuclease NrnB/cAMP/cGMP phosphodiesterase (DHH superfamily)
MTNLKVNPFNGNEKALIIYHQVKPGIDCADGITAAAIAKEALEKKGCQVNLLGCSYQSGFPSVQWEEYKEVYIVDFSFNRKELNIIKKNVAHVFLLDHHMGAFDSLKEDVENEAGIRVNDNRLNRHHNLSHVSDFGLQCIFHFDKSGSEIVWDYFNNNEGFHYKYLAGQKEGGYPGVVAYVGDRDTWKFRLPDSKKINFALSELRHQLGGEAVYQQYKHLSSEELHDELVSLGTDIHQKRENIICSMVDMYTCGTREGTSEVICVGEIPAKYGYLVSDISEALYEKQDIDFVVTYTKNELGVSLRSRSGSGANVCAIAKQFGGGGHYHASGFKRSSIDEYPILVQENNSLCC